MPHNAFWWFLLWAGALFTAGCQGNAVDDVHPPATSPLGASLEDPGLQVEQIQPGVWVHTSYNRFDGVLYPSNGLIVREGDHLILLDPAWGADATEALLVWIDGEIGLPVARALSTHFHADRTAGVDVLQEAGIEVWAHPMTRALSAEQGTPVPEHALASLDQPADAVRFGSMEVLYPGAGHAPDNIMVWLPEQRLLYGGCAIRERATDNLGNTGDADLASWPQAVRRAQQRYPQAKWVVPGHGEPGGPELLSHTLRLF